MNEGIVNLPLCAITFSSHEKNGSMGEKKNGSSLIYQLVFCHFYKVEIQINSQLFIWIYIMEILE